MQFKTHAHEQEHHHGRHHEQCGSCNHDQDQEQCSAHEHDHHEHHEHGHDHDHSHENHWLKAGIGLASGAGLLVLSLLSLNIPMFAYYIITGLTSLMTLYLGINVYKSAWNALKNLKWNTSTLYTISTLTIVAVSIASMFVPGLPMMFEAAPLVLGFWHLGEAIEHTLVGKITEQLDVRDCIPPLALLKGIPNLEVSVSVLIPNDIIIIEKGAVIPVDGVLRSEAYLYTTRFNGEPELKHFKPGDHVSSGMRLADNFNAAEMRVTETYENSYISVIAKNISKANNEKAPVELFANKVLNYFIPGLLTVALVSGIAISLLFNPALAIQCVVAVLVSACPCALSLITPLAVKIGMKKASEQGVHFNNGKALQAAADIDTIVFDLNGTLTKGEIAVRSLRIEDELLLPYFSLLETQSNHPVAKIIKSYIHSRGIVSSQSSTLCNIDTSHHSGIKAVIKVNGEALIIGNKEMLKANAITHIDKPYDDPTNGSIYMVRGKKVIGQIALADPLRDDAIATMNQLRKLGKTVHICTGSDRESAEKYAALLNIPKENIAANTVGAVTKPGQLSKASYIEQLKQKGCKVAMVGDAANDLTAIAYSDIGIAVKSSIGDKVTEQSAGIVVQQGLLFPIATAFDVAKKTKQNIFQNLFMSLTYNSAITLVAAGLFLAIGFALNPALGVALMVLESTIILANLYRFKNQEIVSVASKANKAGLDQEPTKASTTKILNAFNYQPQPKTSLTPMPKPETAQGKHKDLLVPEASSSNYIPEVVGYHSTVASNF